ncbi:MAG: hypothetical protein D6761_08295 [Candidatus Dadabacteria bacterium]|nr:MAG: hypothetical protein D6761_08295 [Candidatus Dadabacteria bacterium]
MSFDRVEPIGQAINGRCEFFNLLDRRNAGPAEQRGQILLHTPLEAIGDFVDRLFVAAADVTGQLRECVDRLLDDLQKRGAELLQPLTEGMWFRFHIFLL